MKGELTDGPPLRRLVAFGLPLVIGSVAHSLFNLVDVWLVGRYAPKVGAFGLTREGALAAIHAASVLNFLPLLVANGISVATIAVVSRAVGIGDSRRCAEIVNRSLVISLALGGIVGVIAGVTSRLQIEALKMAPEAFQAAVDCLEIQSYGSVTMFALLQITAIDRAAGRSFPPLVLLTGANVVNALVSLVFIPRWGAVGAAWATVLSRGVFALIGMAWLYGRVHELRVAPGRLREIAAEARDLLRLAIPASLQLFSRAVAVIFVTRLLAPEKGALEASEATDVTAAYGVALRLEMIAMFACGGFGTAAAAAVGQNLGAGDAARAVRMGWLGAVVAAISMLFVGAAFYLFAPNLFPFFLEEEHAARLQSIVDHGTGYFRIMAFAYCFVGLGIVLAEAINGAGATRVSFAVDFLAYVPGLVALALPLRNAYGLRGLWFAILIVHGVVAASYALLYARVLRARVHPGPALASGRS